MKCHSIQSVFVALACLAAAVGIARGQVAPAGNAHPEASVAENSGHPFGEPVRQPAGTLAQKLEFAKQLDLTPLRDLGVLHGGRVKIVDTLARETVAALTGKDRFITHLKGEDGKLEARSFDPLFTTLDAAIDPAWYAHEPLLHIEYLPLRRKIIELEMPKPPNATKAESDEIDALRERELKLTRVSLGAALSNLARLERDYVDSGPFLAGIGDIRRALSRFDMLGDAMLLVAPEGADDSWHHIAASDYPKSDEVHSITLALGESWRALDAQATNRHIAELAAILPTINAETYPGSRRGLELKYNRANMFTWGYWVYLLATVVLLLAVTTQRRNMRIAGISLLMIAIGLHSIGFLARCFIAERWAIQNQFESMIGVSLFGALLASGIMFARKSWLLGAAAAAMGFLVLVTATEAQIPGKSIGREAAILNTSVLLKYHVTTVLTSYGLITLGFVLSLFYLVTNYAKRLGRGAAAVEPTPASPKRERGGSTPDADTSDSNETKPTISATLRDLDRATLTVLQLAFWTLGVGLLLGAWWADHSWGRWWAFDPKETWALATWIIYLIVIHVRPVAKNRELATAWLSVLGFIVMLWTYFGVNLLLPGLHSYA